MPKRKRGDSKLLPVTSASEVRHLAGPVTDHTIAAILNTEPSFEDLEVAASYVRGEGDYVDRLGHAMTGKVSFTRTTPHSASQATRLCQGLQVRIASMDVLASNPVAICEGSMMSVSWKVHSNEVGGFCARTASSAIRRPMRSRRASRCSQPGSRWQCYPISIDVPIGEDGDAILRDLIEVQNSIRRSLWRQRGADRRLKRVSCPRLQVPDLFGRIMTDRQPR